MTRKNFNSEFEHVCYYELRTLGALNNIQSDHYTSGLINTLPCYITIITYEIMQLVYIYSVFILNHHL